MKNKVIFVILAVSLLLNPQAVLAEEDDIVSISFSNELAIGNSYSWKINNVSSGFGFGYEPNDIVNIDILGDPSINILEGDDVVINLSSIFNISINGDHFALVWDDLVYWFICPTDVGYTNGTHVNLAENLWINIVFDDSYFSHAPYTVLNIGDYVTYTGVLDYQDGSKGYFDGVVNRKTGLVQSLIVSFVEADGIVSEFINLEFSEVEVKFTQAFLPINTLPFVFSIAILAIIMRKRKIKT